MGKVRREIPAVRISQEERCEHNGFISIGSSGRRSAPGKAQQAAPVADGTSSGRQESPLSL